MNALEEMKAHITPLLTRTSLPPLLALDGPAGAGKTTLAQSLQVDLELAVISLDTFFLQAFQRRPDRLREVGGFVDYERFTDQVLLPFSQGKVIAYQVYDCRVQILKPGPCLDPLAYPAVLIEGVYALHPRFQPYYDKSFFLQVSPDLQRSRLNQRETADSVTAFYEDFLPRERAYFQNFSIPESADHLLLST